MNLDGTEAPNSEDDDEDDGDKEAAPKAKSKPTAKNVTHTVFVDTEKEEPTTGSNSPSFEIAQTFTTSPSVDADRIGLERVGFEFGDQYGLKLKETTRDQAEVNWVDNRLENEQDDVEVDHFATDSHDSFGATINQTTSTVENTNSNIPISTTVESETDTDTEQISTADLARKTELVPTTPMKDDCLTSMMTAQDQPVDLQERILMNAGAKDTEFTFSEDISSIDKESNGPCSDIYEAHDYHFVNSFDESFVERFDDIAADLLIKGRQ
ncbi:hypothetical protein HDU76_009456 [Blyttiomyces sp. JEL0837]|nr:hypothetical protein HDU76_009456 [Blyttiomyces sp. JEL0837]